MSRLSICVVVAVAYFVVATPLSQGTPIIRNIGVDVDTDTDSNPVFNQGGFFVGDASGVTVTSTLAIPVVNPGAVFGPAANPGLELIGATLFIDASDVGSGDSFRVRLVFGGTPTLLGLLADTSSAATQVLLVGGGTAPAGAGDVDNSFFTLNSDFFAALTGSSTLAIRIENIGTGGDVRIDGINIQAQFVSVPEPVALGLLFTGFAGLAVVRVRRQK